MSFEDKIWGKQVVKDAMTEQGYTTTRAPYLDELDFDLDARLGTPAGASISADIANLPYKNVATPEERSLAAGGTEVLAEGLWCLAGLGDGVCHVEIYDGAAWDDITIGTSLSDGFILIVSDGTNVRVHNADIASQTYYRIQVG